jgi:hypothetical protein
MQNHLDSRPANEHRQKYDKQRAELEHGSRFKEPLMVQNKKG